jgi:hypothetical protein
MSGGKKMVLQTTSFKEADEWKKVIQDKLAPRVVAVAAISAPRAVVVTKAEEKGVPSGVGPPIGVWPMVAAPIPTLHKDPGPVTPTKTKNSTTTSTDSPSRSASKPKSPESLTNMNTRYARPFGYGVDVTMKSNTLRRTSVVPKSVGVNAHGPRPPCSTSLCFQSISPSLLHPPT